jgi:diadenosine tetraphosphate (Ap4A) HIT family hydrolase
MVAGGGRLPKSLIYEDDLALVFLDGYPRAYGYTLVAPKEHREQVTDDFTLQEYIELQKLVYRVTEAVREEVGASECTSTPSAPIRATPIVHWHVVPLPPGVPYGEQQGNWTRWSKGVLKIPPEEMAALAVRIGRKVERIYPDQ